MFKNIFTLFSIICRPTLFYFCPRNDFSTMSSTDSSWLKLEKIRGKSEKHLNNVLLSKIDQSNGLVIYFGGDGNVLPN